MRRIRLAALAALLALAGTACATASVDTDVDQRFSIAVINEMPHPMIVSIDDGAGARMLGTVAAEREERFVVHGSEGTVTLIARDEGDTHTVRRTVMLEAGEVARVRLN